MLPRPWGVHTPTLPAGWTEQKPGIHHFTLEKRWTRCVLRPQQGTVALFTELDKTWADWKAQETQGQGRPTKI